MESRRPFLILSLTESEWLHSASEKPSNQQEAGGQRVCACVCVPNEKIMRAAGTKAQKRTVRGTSPAFGGTRGAFIDSAF